MRQTVFSLLIPSEPLAVVTTRPAAYRALLAGRANATLEPLGDDDAPTPLPAGTVLIEGLEDCETPVAVLRAVAHRLAPGTRVMALVANAMYAPDVAAFIAGASLAPCHAFIDTELAALFAQAGLTASVTPIAGGSIADATLPLDLALDHLKLRVTERSVADRLVAAGYLVNARA